MCVVPTTLIAYASDTVLRVLTTSISFKSLTLFLDFKQTFLFITSLYSFIFYAHVVLSISDILDGHADNIDLVGVLYFPSDIHLLSGCSFQSNWGTTVILGIRYYLDVYLAILLISFLAELF